MSILKEPEPFDRISLFGAGGDVALLKTVGWLEGTDTARLASECLDGSSLWLELVTSEGTLLGRLQELLGRASR